LVVIVDYRDGSFIESEKILFCSLFAQVKDTWIDKMSSVEIVVLQRFKTGLVEFLDELINWMPTDEELIATRILVNDQMPITVLMDKFVQHILPLESQIANREEKFFLNDPKVFGQVKDQDRILSLKTLWTNPEFTSADKEKAWKWMDFFVKCTRLYRQHHKD
jgi:hypothetical protein